MNENSSPVLRLTRGGTELYASSRKWLHPLLDLTEHARESGLDLCDCDLADKIVGRAAALLIVRLGVARLDAGIMSERAIPVLDAAGIVWHADLVVPRIDCMTEDLLADVVDPDEAYRIVLERARRAAERAAERAATVGVATGHTAGIAVDLVDAVVARDGQAVLREASASIAAGERVLVTGVNGAGKTTLLRAILGIQPLESGSVTVFGTRVDRGRRAAERRRVGYVNQQSVHVEFPVSVREVVEIGLCTSRLPRRDRDERVARSMAAAAITHLERRLYSTLSGGEKQRTAIARCLCQEPDLLLLDEPTASLDAAGKRDFMALIERLHADSGITIILVTHEIDTVPHAGWRHLAIHEGALVAVEGGQS